MSLDYRRRLGLALTSLIAFAAIASPATAGGSFDNDYQGRAEGDSTTYFGFDLAKQNGKTKVKNLEAVLNYHCRGEGGNGPRGVLGRAKGSLSVSDSNTFAGKLRGVLPERGGNASLTYSIHGKLGKRGKAAGTIAGDLTIPVVRPRGGNTLRCYSGGLDWKAKKGAHVTRTPPRARGGRG